MSIGYTRQESFVDGDIVEAGDFENEFNQLAVAFDKDDGHAHDGSDDNGSFIPLIKEKTTDTSVRAVEDKVVFTISGNVDIFEVTTDGTALFLNGYDINSLQSDLNSKFSPSNKPSWDDITSKPSEFTPSSHTHAISQIVGLTSELNNINNNIIALGIEVDECYSPTNPPPSGGSVEWDEVVNKPSTFPPSSHTHTASEITDFKSNVAGLSDNIGNVTLGRTGRLTYATVTNGNTRTITLNESTFSNGDIVEIDVLDSGGTVTITTSTGTIYTPDNADAGSHTLTNKAAVIRLYKHSSNNWRVRVY